MRRFCVLCVLKFGTVCSVLFFYIVLFVCVRAAFYGAINDNKITEVGVVPAAAARNLNTRKTVRALCQLFSKQNIDGKCGRVRA